MLVALFLAVAQTPPPPIGVPRGTLVVHLVDPEGALVLEDFVVHATQLWPVALGERGPERKADLDREDGTATFEGLGAGRYVVEAAHRTGDWAASVEVELRAHARVSCELRLATPPPSRCLYVVAGGPEIVGGLQLVACGPSGEAFSLELAKDSLNRYVARGVAPGRYSVTVVDPRYRATTIEDVVPGEVAQLALQGSASLALRFRAVPGGAALRPRAIEVALGSTTRPTWHAHEDPPVEQLDGLEPGEVLALAHFEGRAPVLFRVTDLQHGERRELELEVPLGATLSGRVVDADGAPVPDVLVSTHTTVDFGTAAARRLWIEPGRAYQPRPDELAKRRADGAPVPNVIDSTGTTVTFGTDATRRLRIEPGRAYLARPDELGKRRTARTDSTGRYTLAGLAPGSHVITAYGTPFTQRSASVDIGAEDDTRTAPDIALVGSASADVAVRLPAGLHPTEVQLLLQIGSSSWLKQLGSEQLSAQSESSRLQLRGLPETPCTLVLSQRSFGLNGAEETVPLARVTFVPQRGVPTPVLLAARHQ